jgi:hypothetical protein
MLKVYYASELYTPSMPPSDLKKPELKGISIPKVNLG